ncbi:MAG: hypothetical protein NT019_03475 [Candidatus Adlerbacteria bacterium]|nr:hypothetical protein [Candidatus Adlerbacteria bacterium]
MSSLGKFLHRHFLPSKHNAYRPHMLHRTSLLFFIAIIFVSEGLFVSSFFVGEGTNISVAAVGAATVAQPHSSLQTLERELIKFIDNSKPAVPWILGTIALLLSIAVLFAFFVHIQIQQPQMLFSAALVALFALSLIATNVQVATML